VIHLREHNIASTTPIPTYFESNCRHPIKPNDITLVLLRAICLIGPEVGLTEADVSARSLRAGGAMALLCAQVDDNIICLVGRLQSNDMLHYLHMQARPVMRNANVAAWYVRSHPKYTTTKTPRHVIPSSFHSIPFPPFLQLGLHHQLCYWEMVVTRAHSKPLVTTGLSIVMCR
jgi:hypothetical protein